MVQRHYPALPSHPLLASAWVGLLAGGALDAEAYPDRARAVLQALWAATRHPEEQVWLLAVQPINPCPPLAHTLVFLLPRERESRGHHGHVATTLDAAADLLASVVVCADCVDLLAPGSLPLFTGTCRCPTLRSCLQHVNHPESAAHSVSAI